MVCDVSQPLKQRSEFAQAKKRENFNTPASSTPAHTKRQGQADSHAGSALPKDKKAEQIPREKQRRMRGVKSLIR